MADAQDPVRIDVIRAIAQLEGDDGALLLRLMARMGDRKARVTGQVLESIISVEGQQGVSFVSGFLEAKSDEICEEAALALGASRLPAGFAALRDAWSRERDRQRGTIFLRAMSASGLPEAIDFLVGLIAEGLQRESDAAVQALEFYSDSEQIQERVRAALNRRRDR
jgi:hypothetical protein